MKILAPESLTELHNMVSSCYANSTQIQIQGFHSKSGFGNIIKHDAILSTKQLSGIEFYEPEELTLRVKAGTSLELITTLLQEQNQQLAFEPAFLGQLYGNVAKLSSIGGIVACNAVGPRRVYAGSVRDSLMGVEMVSGFGDIIHSGGRVMKNVTGFDLVKLMCGSLGTLGVLHSLTLQTVPIAESIQTVVFLGLDHLDAGQLMRKVLSSDLIVTSAAYLPAELVNDLDGSITLLRIEGSETAMPNRFKRLKKLAAMLNITSKFDVLNLSDAAKQWSAIRDCSVLNNKDDLLFKVSLPADQGPKIYDEFIAKMNHRGFLDWGGSLVWISIPLADGFSVSEFRQKVQSLGGHATLMRANSEIHQQCNVTHPQPKALAALSERVRNNFDPRHILNPGLLLPINQ